MGGGEDNILADEAAGRVWALIGRLYHFESDHADAVVGQLAQLTRQNFLATVGVVQDSLVVEWFFLGGVVQEISHGSFQV